MNILRSQLFPYSNCPMSISHNVHRAAQVKSATITSCTFLPVGTVALSITSRTFTFTDTHSYSSFFFSSSSKIVSSSPLSSTLNFLGEGQIAVVRLSTSSILDPLFAFLTLGAHAQRGLQYLVCVSVTQHLTFHVFIRATNDTKLLGGG